jgi:hypothetical protein
MQFAKVVVKEVKPEVPDRKTGLEEIVRIINMEGEVSQKVEKFRRGGVPSESDVIRQDGQAHTLTQTVDPLQYGADSKKGVAGVVDAVEEGTVPSHGRVGSGSKKQKEEDV